MNKLFFTDKMQQAVDFDVNTDAIIETIPQKKCLIV